MAHIQRPLYAGAVPVVTWRHASNSALLLRSAQPLVGVTRARCREDEMLLEVASGAGQAGKAEARDEARCVDQHTAPALRDACWAQYKLNMRRAGDPPADKDDTGAQSVTLAGIRIETPAPAPQASLDTIPKQTQTPGMHGSRGPVQAVAGCEASNRTTRCRETRRAQARRVSAARIRGKPIIRERLPAGCAAGMSASLNMDPANGSWAWTVCGVQFCVLVPGGARQEHPGGQNAAHHGCAAHDECRRQQDKGRGLRAGMWLVTMPSVRPLPARTMTGPLKVCAPVLIVLRSSTTETAALTSLGSKTSTSCASLCTACGLLS
jgi:hypothetical protein